MPPVTTRRAVVGFRVAVPCPVMPALRETPVRRSSGTPSVTCSPASNVSVLLPSVAEPSVCVIALPSVARPIRLVMVPPLPRFNTYAVIDVSLISSNIEPEPIVTIRPAGPNAKEDAAASRPPLIVVLPV